MKLSALVAALAVCLSLPTILVAQEDLGFLAPQQSGQLQPVQLIPETIDKIELKDNLKEYPIWLVIKPEGVRFLQTEEEIALHQNQIPLDAFLVGCQQATFEASSNAEKRAFDLKCEKFVLMGSYGAKQHVEAKGAALSYSTTNDQLQLSGAEKQPVEARLNGQESTTLLSAEQIKLNLHHGPITKTKDVPVRKGQYQAVTEESDLPLTHFQLSAEKIISLEIHPSPTPQKNTSTQTFDPFAP
ncbi:MAG: hypothetical protein HUJ26_01125 [Planctomycetaceae bacterium]|nr:hypothetical protein [Planctomycetaceae bacterium]